MQTYRRAWAALLLVAAGAANAAESANELARSMMNAQRSPGFEARFRVWTMRSDAPEGRPSRFSLVGESAGDGARIVLRELTAGALQPLATVARSDGSGTVSVECQTSARACNDGGRDPSAAQPFPGLYLWDMLAPWWAWPEQSLQGEERLDGRACTVITSLAHDNASRVHSVTSCVDERNAIALKTILRDSRGVVVRRIDVEAFLRRSSGKLMPKRLLITAPDEPPVRLEVYAGDERYEIRADTFPLSRPSADPGGQKAMR